MITVLVKEPRKEAKLERIVPTCESFQKLVGGHLEGVSVRDNVYMYVDDEGKLKHKPANFSWRHGDIVVGTAVFFGVNEHGEEISLTDEQIATIELELELRKLVSTPFFQVKIEIL